MWAISSPAAALRSSDRGDPQAAQRTDSPNDRLRQSRQSLSAGAPVMGFQDAPATVTDLGPTFAAVAGLVPALYAVTA